MITKSFSALVLSLPSKDKTVRMRIWRALRGMGCGVLRDGVYLLPADAAQAAGFGNLESNVKAAGGIAMTRPERVSRMRCSTRSRRAGRRASRLPDASRRRPDRNQNRASGR